MKRPDGIEAKRKIVEKSEPIKIDKEGDKIWYYDDYGNLKSFIKGPDVIFKDKKKYSYYEKN